MSRANWGSKLGFILAAAGSAVGLGAIWKFPYVAGQNGGGAFLITYLVCVFTLGIGMLLAEMLIGRAAGKSATTAYRELKNRYWAWAGRLSVLCVFLILSFYCVIGGWAIAYLFKSISGEAIIAGGELAKNTELLGSMFGNFIADPVSVIGYTAAYFALTVTIVLGGVQSGIERMSKILMPALFILMLVLIAQALSLPGAMDGVHRFIEADFDKLTGKAVLEAMGLAIFSLSIGGGMIIAYGSYLGRDTKLVGATLWVSVLATLACILAGLMVLPTVFAFGIDPKAGPGLTFITMPALFAQMGEFGQLFAIAFFSLLIFAALTSSVSILEPIVAFLIDEYGWQRKPAALAIGAASFALSIPAALSFGVMSDVTLFGMTAFDLMDFIACNVLMPAGGLLAAMFAGWAIWPRVEQELKAENIREDVLKAVKMICTYFAPVVIGMIWLQGVFKLSVGYTIASGGYISLLLAILMVVQRNRRRAAAALAAQNAQAIPAVELGK